MGPLVLPVGIVVERRRLASPWAEFAWVPMAALPGAPEVAPWTPLHESDRSTTYFGGTLTLTFHRSETANYVDNLASGRAALWVVLRAAEGEPPIQLIAVTADPGEGEALTAAGGDIVEPVPMPAEIQAELQAFIDQHHVERGFYKRQRDERAPEPPPESDGRSRIRP